MINECQCDYTNLLLLLMNDSRSGASNDDDMGEWILEDWRE